MKFEVGKLYRCPDYFLLIYPTIEKARAATLIAHDFSTGALARAAYWSEKLDCQVRFSERGEIFMLLKGLQLTYFGSKSWDYFYVLFGNRQGWIIYKDWLGIQRARHMEFEIECKHV